MYHFVADHPPVPVRLSFRALIPGHVRQYLKQFQIDAIQFMHNFLAKGEFCVYNDESGLGKQAAVAMLLDAACGNKKTLIVVQNDDSYVNGWEFHFSVLTNSKVMVIKEKKDSTDGPHNIYIAKWSTLRAIDDLSKFDFDFIILDNRGQMLNNSFCTSMLIKQYECKINILISSVDITSDLKLLHNILKLGGRLDPRYSTFKAFEEKFKLPDAKELAYKKVDLEDYFLRRERLADYCKHYRLRRYCHQFEQQLPLVAADRYKINLDIWRDKQNATNSESSSVEISSQNQPEKRVRDTQELFEEYCKQRRKQQEREKLKQQLQEKRRERKELEEQRQREAEREQETDLEIVSNVDDEVAFINATPAPVRQTQPSNSRENTDEGVLMSPLLVVSDSEDPDDVPQICNDPNEDTDVVDLSSEEEDVNNENNKGAANNEAWDNEHLPCNEENGASSENGETNKDVAEIVNSSYGEENDTTEENFANKEKAAGTGTTDTTKKANKKRKIYRREIDRLKDDVATNLKFQNENTPKRRTRHDVKSQRPSSGARRSIIVTDRATRKDGVKNDTNSKTRKSIVMDSAARKSKDDQMHKKGSQKCTKIVGQEKQQPSSESTKNKTVKAAEKDDANAETTQRSSRKQAHPVKNNSKMSDVKKKTVIEKQKTVTAPNIVVKIEPGEKSTPETKRSCAKIPTLERIKRELDLDHVAVHTKETRSMQRLTRSAGTPNKPPAKRKFLAPNDPKSAVKPKKKPQEKEESHKTQPKLTTQTQKSKSKDSSNDTQAPIISSTCTQDYEHIQCAQRLSDVGAFDINTQKKTPEFLVPATPSVLSRNSLIPLSLTSSNGFFAESEVIFVPPVTPNAAGPSGSKTNKRNEDIIVLSGSDNENSCSTSRRTRALKPRRLQKPDGEVATSKVPTFSQLLAQHNTRKSAKSPDLFSNCSDIGQLTLSQPPAANADDEPNAPFEGFKIFGSEVKQLQQHYALAKTQNATKNGKKAYHDRSCLDILENMFEPANKNQKTKVTSTTNGQESTGNKTPTKKITKKLKPQGPIVPHHPIEAIAEAQARANKLKNKRSLVPPPLDEDEIFEITNNGTFGSVMRLHSNGEISPVQKSAKVPNKITKYFMGGLTQNLTGSQEDSGNNSEAGTPSKRQQHQQQQQQTQPAPQQQVTSTQVVNTKKSPKQKCSLTQTTKLTKWFTKNSPVKQIQTQVARSSSASGSKSTSTGKRQVKWRRLDLTQVVDDTD